MIDKIEQSELCIIGSAIFWHLLAGGPTKRKIFTGPERVVEQEGVEFGDHISWLDAKFSLTLTREEGVDLTGKLIHLLIHEVKLSVPPTVLVDEAVSVLDCCFQLDGPIAQAER